MVRKTKIAEEFVQGFGLSNVPYLKGLDLAKEIFEEGVKRGLPIVLKGDPDVDGLFSYDIARQLLTKKGYLFSSCVNRDRKHGLIEEEFVELKNRTWKPYKKNKLSEEELNSFTLTGGLGDKYIPTEWHKDELIINVDSSISGKEMQMLVDNGCFVISLDHHELELDGYLKDQRHFSCSESYMPSDGFGVEMSYKGRGVIINNQYEDEPSELRFWSGTGVTLQAMCYILGVEPKKEHLVMHGISLLSDVRDIENPLARELLELTYKTPLYDLPLINKLARVSNSEVPEIFRKNVTHLDRVFIDYTLSPFINASYQLNLGEFLFDLVSTKKTQGMVVKETRRKIVENLKQSIKIKRFSRLTLLLLDLSWIEESDVEELYDFSYTSFLGLVANSFLKEGKTVAIFANDKGKFVRGSVRGVSHHIDYRSIFGKKWFTVKGHQGAFGITEIDGKPNFDLINKTIEQLESNLEVKSNVIKMKNLLDNQAELIKIAYENQFLLSQNQVGIKYKGLHYSVKNETAKTVTYDVTGMSVFTYDKELNLKNSIIVPVIECDNLTLTLKKE